MIKNYNLFLINEKISISNDDIIDVIKSLEGKNDILINKLVNTVDNSGKSVLMNIVQSNNEELINYILKFKLDINHKTKTGENILFFCKSIKIFKKFYELGADINAKNINLKRNILTFLAARKLYNVDLYQKLINDGIDINETDASGYSVLTDSILNLGIVQLLIKNNVDLNNEEIQGKYLHTLLYAFEYFENKRRLVTKIFHILFENGMKIIDVEYFAERILQLENWRHDINILDFIIPLKKYISEDILIYMFEKKISHLITIGKDVEFSKKLLNIDINPKLYLKIKNTYQSYYGKNKFEEFFSDYIEEHPYLDATYKYNI